MERIEQLEEAVMGVLNEEFDIGSRGQSTVINCRDKWMPIKEYGYFVCDANAKHLIPDEDETYAYKYFDGEGNVVYWEDVEGFVVNKSTKELVDYLIDHSIVLVDYHPATDEYALGPSLSDDLGVRTKTQISNSKDVKKIVEQPQDRLEWVKLLVKITNNKYWTVIDCENGSKILARILRNNFLKVSDNPKYVCTYAKVINNGMDDIDFIGVRDDISRTMPDLSTNNIN